MKFRKITKMLRKHLPTILTSASIVTGGATLYFTIKATVKAGRKYDELKKNGVEITPKVVFKELFVPYYIPATGFAMVSLGTNIASNVVHVKRNRALKLAAKSAIESLQDFKATAKNVVGVDKLNEIEEQQAKNAVVLSTGSYDDPILVYDVEERVKVQTTRRLLNEAENAVNEQLSSSGHVRGWTTLGDFYTNLGLEETLLKRIPCSSKQWDVFYMGATDETNWVSFSEKECFDSDGTPMIMLYYYPCPVYEEEINQEFD